MNKFEEVAGRLVLTDECLEFQADRSQQWRQPHDMCDMTIDYLDVVSVCRLQIPNEEAIFNDDEFFTKNYKFSYMV